MNTKREIILNSIIKEYLKSNSPIGSNELRMKLEFDISASTIRVYFKQLSHEGELEQLHVSSGRVPTHRALKRYWQTRLSIYENIKICSLQRLKVSAEKFGIYCMITFFKDERLKEILNVSHRYILLLFEKNEIVLKYSEKVEKFLSNFIGYTIKELRDISAQIGLYELHKKINSVMEGNNFVSEGRMIVYEMAKEQKRSDMIDDFLKTKIFDIEDGIYFENFVPKGYMALKQSALVENEDAKIFCLGHLHNDFEGFFEYNR